MSLHQSKFSGNEFWTNILYHTNESRISIGFAFAPEEPDTVDIADAVSVLKDVQPQEVELKLT